MKKLVCIAFLLLSCILLPTVVYAQPAHKHHSTVVYHHVTPSPHVRSGYVYRCRTVLLPVMHEVCGYVRVYTPQHREPPQHRGPVPPHHAPHHVPNGHHR